MSGTPQVTLICPLYNASAMALRLVESFLSQKLEGMQFQSEWLEVILIDDCSKDGTAEAVRAAIESKDCSQWIRLEKNSKNLGLAGTLNRGFELAQSEWVLTCHCDCIMADEFYIQTLLRLIQTDETIAAITGQPVLPQSSEQPAFAERVNIVANLMDVFPIANTPELVPIAFAEGRCDLFRKSALTQVGYYDTTLRTSGEDQVLAAQLRAKGFRICKATRALYFLGVSAEQDSISKLIRHTFLFGETLPYPLYMGWKLKASYQNEQIGENRKDRSRLRILHLLTIGGVLVWGIWAWVVSLVLKSILFRKHWFHFRWTIKEVIFFVALQPVFDVAYFLGFMKGSVRLLRIHYR